MNLGKSIKIFRKELNISQQDLAIKTGLSPTTISAYETNTNMPTLNNLETIAGVLGTSVNMLVLCSIDSTEISVEKRETFEILMGAITRIIVSDSKDLK